ILVDSEPDSSLHRGECFMRSCADAVPKQTCIKVASMNHGWIRSRSECCAICGPRFVWTLVYPLNSGLAAASARYARCFVADRASKISHSLKLRMIKAIFFDAAGTLFFLTKTVGDHYALVSHEFGLDLDAQN